MPRATLVLHRKRRFNDGAISEMKLWLVQGPVRGSRHRFRYSLFYGRDGQRLIGYDNEPGKGDHRHYGKHKKPYDFSTPERLIADFLADLHALRRARRH
ncbi:MAG TPA: DUF6516 family protein [Acetobacteraceae bacterium]|jgi:hypothetical protein